MSRLTCPLFDSFLEPRRSLPLDFSFRSPSRCNERNIRSIRKWLCAPSAVNSDLGSPCCKLQGYCNRVARVGGCKRCRRRGDKGAFTSSAGDPRVPLYLPSVGINCLSPDNGVMPLIPGRALMRFPSVKIPKSFSRFGTKSSDCIPLIVEEDISSGWKTGNIRAWAWLRGDDNNERKFIGTLHVDNFYSYIVLSAAPFLRFTICIY